MSVAVAALKQFNGVSTKGNLSLWRVSHHSASVSLCRFEGHKSEPVCYPWNAGSKGELYAIIPGDDVLSLPYNTSSGAVSLCEHGELSDALIFTPWSQ